MDISLKDDDYDRSGTEIGIDKGEGEGGDIHHGVGTVSEPIVIDKQKRDAVVAMFKVGWDPYSTVFNPNLL